MQATIDRPSGSLLGRDDIADVCTLSPMQEGMLFHDLYEKERSPGALISHLMELTFRVEGDFDVDRFEESWNRLIARHEVLRSVFNYTVAERPLQIVLRRRRITLDRHDLAGRPAAEQARFVAACRQRQRETPFDLTRDLLLRIAVIRLAPALHQVVWAFHHILMDGWCLNVLQRELLDIYEALGRGVEPPLPRPVPYSAYLKRLQARDARSSLEFWKDCLRGYERPVHPPGWRRPAGAGTALLHHVVELEPAESRALAGLAAALQATVNNVFQAAWGLLLGRYNGCADAVFGIVVAGRPHEIPGISEMVGLCANTVPLRVRTAPGTRLADLIRQVRDGFLAVLEHEHDPLADIQALTAPKRDLVNHLLVFESFPRDLRFEGARIEPLPGLVLDGFETSMPNNYDFQVAVFPDPERLRIVLTHREGAFHPGQAELIGGHLRRVLATMAAEPSRTVESVDILDPEERAGLLAGGVSVPPPAGEESLAARLERLLAGSQPAATADGQELTWEALGERSGRLARHLAHAHGIGAGIGPGIGPGRRVALQLPATPDLIVALCAVIRAGAAFVPLDPANPPARTAHILEDCRPAAVLAERDLDATAWEPAPAGPLPPPARSETCYILYTSGTTGRPKGVKVGEASLLNYVEWLRTRFGIGPGDRTALLSSHAFDLGYTALFGALLNGATLHLPDEATRRDPEALVELCVTRRLTFLKLTPALLHLLVHAANAGRLAEAEALRLVFLGGEGYVPADLRELRRLCPWVRLRNHYGPTESTIGCVSYELDPEEPDVAAGRQVIGHPIDGALAWVLDERREPVPAGVAGDLYVGGRCLAQGYTSETGGERFCAAPWDPGRRLYRTGDRAERRPDGALVFLGRYDDQVKIRGYRVEPAEVEAVLRRLPGVMDAVVLARPGHDGQTELTAFALCPQDGADGEPEAGELRGRMAAALPEYMVPSQVVPVFRFPLTANGKVDRQALAAHQPLLRRTGGGEVRGETERAIQEIWQSVLGLAGVGPDDDFFQLGGHSVKAILVLSRVAKRLGVKLALRDFFDYPTLRQLARRVEAGRAGTRPPAVRLKDAGPQAPRLYFLPPVAGTSTLYKEAVEALEVEVSAWGLQCRGFDVEEPFDRSLAEMAAFFAGEIRTLQPRGPYLLCGYSMGVASALETAALLEAAGQQAALILVDGAAGGGAGAAEPSVQVHAPQRWQHLLSILAANLEPRDLERIGRLTEHNLRLLQEHRATAVLSADLFCIEAADNPEPAGMEALRRLTTGRFFHRQTPGDHYSLIHPPNSAALVGHLAEAVRTLAVGRP